MIDDADLERLVAGQHHDPHHLLGPHPERDSEGHDHVVIRGWRPAPPDDATAPRADPRPAGTTTWRRPIGSAPWWRTSSCPSATTRWRTARDPCSARCPATAGSSSPTCAPCWPGCGPTPAGPCCSWAARSPRTTSGTTTPAWTGTCSTTPSTPECRHWSGRSTPSTAPNPPCGSRTSTGAYRRSHGRSDVRPAFRRRRLLG